MSDDMEDDSGEHDYSKEDTRAVVMVLAMFVAYVTIMYLVHAFKVGGT